MHKQERGDIICRLKSSHSGLSSTKKILGKDEMEDLKTYTTKTQEREENRV